MLPATQLTININQLTITEADIIVPIHECQKNIYRRFLLTKVYKAFTLITVELF